VSASVMCFKSCPKSRPMRVSDNTTRKKSKESSVHPARLAMNAPTHGSAGAHFPEIVGESSHDRPDSVDRAVDAKGLCGEIVGVDKGSLSIPESAGSIPN